MSKKRTRKDKIKADTKRVNSQFEYKFSGTYNNQVKNESAVLSEKSSNLASIKKELLKSLIIATLITTSLLVLYWFS